MGLVGKKTSASLLEHCTVSVELMSSISGFNVLANINRIYHPQC